MDIHKEKKRKIFAVAGCDDEANNFISEGFSREEAYTVATEKMTHSLLKTEFLSTLLDEYFEGRYFEAC